MLLNAVRDRLFSLYLYIITVCFNAENHGVHSELPDDVTNMFI